MATETVTDLIKHLKASPNDDQWFQEGARWLLEATGADTCEILTPTEGGALVVRASTTDPSVAERARLARGVGLVGHVFTTGESLAVPRDLATHPLHRELPGLAEKGFESAMIVPYGDGSEPDGVVYLRRRRKWALNKTEVTRIEKCVRRLGLTLVAFLAGFEMGSQSDRFNLLTEATRTLSASPYLEEILQLLVNMTARRFNYRVVTVRLLDESRQELILRATQATNKAYQRKRAIRLGESIAGKAISSQVPVVVEDVMADPDYIGHDLAEVQGLRSMICVPLIVQGRPVGVMSCYTGEVREFPEDEVEVLETLAKQAAVSIEHAKLQVRTTLMQEMHHRVKNNLQQVASLLRLQMRQSHYKSLEEALTDSLGRIQAIAAVHELLSRDDLDHVSIKHIAEMLGHHQQQSFIMPGKTISFSVRGDDVHLNTSQATQVALIINEMIQNAVEHGFEKVDRGEIHITVEERKEGEIGLWVSNNGEPLPEGFDYKSTGQLGLQIIRSLSMALGGNFKIENRLGWTVCEVIFDRQSAE